MKEISVKIANASVIAAAMVVGIHTAGMEIGTFKLGSAIWWWLALGMYGMFQIAVPFFFLCSGYFIAGHIGEDGWYRRECRKRVRSLLIPYISWSLLYFALESLVSCASGLVHGRSIVVNMDIRSWVRTLGLLPFEYPRLWPLWYVRTLIVFVILSPVLKRMVNVIGVIGLFVLATCLEIHFKATKIDFLLQKGLCLFGLFFFMFGMLLRHRAICLPKRGHIVALMTGCCIVVVSACLRRWYGVSFFPRTLCATLLIFELWRFMPTRAFPDWITNSSFPVFVLHPFFLYLWCCILPCHISTISMWVLKWLFCIGGSIIVAVTLRHNCPKMATFVFGGR